MHQHRDWLCRASAARDVIATSSGYIRPLTLRIHSGIFGKRRVSSTEFTSYRIMKIKYSIFYTDFERSYYLSVVKLNDSINRLTFTDDKLRFMNYSFQKLRQIKYLINWSYKTRREFNTLWKIRCLPKITDVPDM